jgi:hypothetical protein
VDAAADPAEAHRRSGERRDRGMGR